MRNLAQRSSQAAKEIKELIGDSVEKVGAGGSLVDEEVDLAQAVGMFGLGDTVAASAPARAVKASKPAAEEWEEF